MNTQFVRSRSDKMIGGVCGGIARYFNIDPVIVRLIFVLSVFLGGVSPLIYILLWIVMPEEPAGYSAPQQTYAAPQALPEVWPGYSSMSSSGYSDSESWGDSESEADIPIFFPVPFQELSSVQYYSLDEQLTELTAALKNQFQRHCFIKLMDEETQPLLVPFVDGVTSFRDRDDNLHWYIGEQNRKQDALPPPEIDRLLEAQETALLQETLATGATVVDVEPEDEAEAPPSKVISVAAGSAWQRPAGTAPKPLRKKPSP